MFSLPFLHLRYNLVFLTREERGRRGGDKLGILGMLVVTHLNFNLSFFFFLIDMAVQLADDVT